MAQIIIPQPTSDAFSNGPLNLAWTKLLVKVVNLPLKVRGGGGKFLYSEEDITLVLEGKEELCYIIKNGEPIRCYIRIREA